MKVLSNLSLVLLAACIGLSSSAKAQSSYQPSSKFIRSEFVKGSVWDGLHRFGNVFCLTFPRSTEAKELTEGMFNANTLYFQQRLLRRQHSAVCGDLGRPSWPFC